MATRDINAVAYVSAGSFVGLRPVEVEDYQAIRAAELSPTLITRYRMRATTPPPEAASLASSNGVLTQFVVTSLETGDGVGVVALHDADFRSQTCQVSGFIHPALHGAGWPCEGFLLLLDYAFDQFNFRKVYAEVLDSNYVHMSTIDRHVGEIEGVLKEHEFVDGRFADKLILAVTQAHWRNWRSRSLQAAGRLDCDGDTERVLASLSAELGWNADRTRMDTPLGDVVADSIDLVQLACLIDSLRDDEIPLEVLASLATVRDVVNLVQVRGV